MLRINRSALYCDRHGGLIRKDDLYSETESGASIVWICFNCITQKSYELGGAKWCDSYVSEALRRLKCS